MITLIVVHLSIPQWGCKSSGYGNLELTYTYAIRLNTVIYPNRFLRTTTPNSDLPSRACISVMNVNILPEAPYLSHYMLKTAIHAVY